MKEIKMYWGIFLIVLLVIFLLGVIIGLIVIPHPSVQPEESEAITQTGPEKVREKAETVVTGVEAGVVPEIEEPVQAVGKIEAPKPIKKVNPVYPEDARQARVEGVVILEATTDDQGRVKKVRVLRSIPLLDQAAIDAVSQWVYEPKMVEGKPRGVTFTVTVQFKLK